MGRRNPTCRGCCCVPSSELLSCQCITEDYGDRHDLDSIDVVFPAGSATCTKVGIFCGSGTFTGEDWAGTYSASIAADPTPGRECSARNTWFSMRYACPAGSGETWMQERLVIELFYRTPISTYTIDVSLESWVYNLPVSSANPCPGISTSCSPGASGSLVRDTTWSYQDNYTFWDTFYTNPACGGDDIARSGCLNVVPVTKTTTTHNSLLPYCDHSTLTPTITIQHSLSN